MNRMNPMNPKNKAKICPSCENTHDGQIFHSAEVFLATLNFTS